MGHGASPGQVPVDYIHPEEALGQVPPHQAARGESPAIVAAKRSVIDVEKIIDCHANTFIKDHNLR